MRWRKIGRVFDPEAHRSDWLVSHAALPCVHAIGKRRVRVYFGARDDQGRSQIGAFTLDLDDPLTPRDVTPRPMLTRGPLGTFSDNGVSPAAVVPYEDRLYLYYTGWNLGVTVPFYTALGLAISEDGGQTYQKVSDAPVLDRQHREPYMIVTGHVLRQVEAWRMWLISVRRWEATAAGIRHYYNVRYAESLDGVRWSPLGETCVDFADETEYAFGRPCVQSGAGGYHMWYCVRGERYRPGYAWSPDGRTWMRRDEEVGIAPAAAGWDAEMIAYPCVFELDGQTYMLYNGNGYARTGIGLAVLETPLPDSRQEFGNS